MTWADARRAAEDGGSRAVEAAAQHLLDASKAVAPIERGALGTSADYDVDGPEASVFYDTPYAVKQHEDLDEQHDQGRRGKYLEGPLYAEASAALELMASELRRAFR